MFKRFTVLICVALLLTACYKYKEPEKPENLIPKDKMVNILIDLRLIKSISGKNKKVLDSNNVKAAQYIYNKYNIDSLEFALSNDYYTFHITDYEEIYTKMKDSLDALKEKYKDLIKEEIEAKKKADSLDKVEKNKKIEALKDSLEVKTEKSLKPVSSGK